MSHIMIDQETFEIADVIGLATLQGDKDIADIAKRFVVLKLLCETQNVAPNLSEINDALSEWREGCEFEDSADFRSWMREYGVTENALKMFAMTLSMEEALIENIPHDEFLARQNDEVDIAELRDVYGIMVKSKKDASKLAQSLQNDPSIFFETARQHSIEPTSRVQCGYLGRMTKEDLPQSLAESLFAIDGGEIVGPVDFDDCFIVCTAHAVIETDNAFTDDDNVILLDEMLDEMIAKEMNKRVTQRLYLEAKNV